MKIYANDGFSLLKCNAWKLLAVVLVSVHLNSLAAGEEKPYAVTVQDRERPRLDALGINAGSFRLLPSVELKGIFDDNVFAESSQTIDDFVTIIEPELALVSNWGTHRLAFLAGSTVGRYQDNSDEDYEDYYFDVDAKIDVQHSTSISMNAGYERNHIGRGSPNDNNGFEPTIFNITSLAAAFEHTFNHVTTYLGATTEKFDYEDVSGPAGKINNDDGDRDVFTGTLKIDFELYPYNSAFIRLTGEKTEYVDRLDDNGVNRSSIGYKFDFGSDFRFSSVLYGEIFIGSLHQNFDGSTLNSIEEVLAGGSLTWVPSGLTTVKFAALRDVDETIVGTSAGILSTAIGIEIDHELRRNILLRANANSSEDDFKGSNRVDSYLRFGAGGLYMMNRSVYISLDYSFEERDSNAPGGGQDFSNNQFLLAIRLQK